jgi:ABC-type multidrug transport system permease subunit
MVNNNDWLIILIGFGIPFLAFVIIFCWLVAFNRKTTGEIKYILPPDVFLKVMAVIMVVVVTFILTFCKIMEVSVTAAILGSVVTGTITSIKKSE